MRQMAFKSVPSHSDSRDRTKEPKAHHREASTLLLVPSDDIHISWKPWYDLEWKREPFAQEVLQ
jgi:hypothetical protein